MKLTEKYLCRRLVVRYEPQLAGSIQSAGVHFVHHQPTVRKLTTSLQIASLHLAGGH